jgi:hypothetical protein
MATGNSGTYQEGASSTMVNDVPSTIMGLRVVGYPAILNEEIGVVALDSYCSHHGQF